MLETAARRTKKTWRTGSLVAWICLMKRLDEQRSSSIEVEMRLRPQPPNEDHIYWLKNVKGKYDVSIIYRCILLQELDEAACAWQRAMGGDIAFSKQSLACQCPEDPLGTSLYLQPLGARHGEGGKCTSRVLSLARRVDCGFAEVSGPKVTMMSLFVQCFLWLTEGIR